MKKFSHILIGFFSILLLAGLTGCNKDDDNEESNLTTSELLIGTWTVTDFDLSARIGSQSLIDYLIEFEGLSPAEAEELNAVFEAFLESEVTGTLTIKADRTYVSNFGEGSTSGTWSLSSDEKTLTLTEEGTDSIIIKINSISATTWIATISESSPEDLDDDPGTPDVLISIEITLTLKK
jgi:hypothetical protein